MSTIKVDTINTRTGSGNITFSRPTVLTAGDIVEADLATDAVTTVKIVDDAVTIAKLAATGTASSTTFLRGDNAWAAAGGGDVRNFIIDGDFTQWPEGTSFTSMANVSWTHALWQYRVSGYTSLNITISKETSVLPAVGDSDHESHACLKYLVSTAETAASGDLSGIRYHVTGADAKAFWNQTATGVVWGFWCRCSVAGTYGYSFDVSGDTYVNGFTINAADTWEFKTITLQDLSALAPIGDFDTGEATRLDIILSASGSKAISAGWQGSNSIKGLTGQTNLGDTLNATFYLAQVGLYIGSSAPTFLGEPIATVKNQVDYYVQRWGSPETTAANDPTPTGGGHNSATTTADYTIVFRRLMRAEPTMTESSAAGFRIYHTAAVPQTTNMVEQATTLYGTRYVATISSGLTQGHASQLLFDATDDFIMADARH